MSNTWQQILTDEENEPKNEPHVRATCTNRGVSDLKDTYYAVPFIPSLSFAALYIFSRK